MTPGPVGTVGLAAHGGLITLQWTLITERGPAMVHAQVLVDEGGGGAPEDVARAIVKALLPTWSLLALALRGVPEERWLEECRAAMQQAMAEEVLST